MTDKTSLGDRMKKYEVVPRMSLSPRMPMIVRVDGRAFHTYVKKLHHGAEELGPWNPVIRDAMTDVARALMGEIAGAKIAYVQSDEVSVLVTDYDSLGARAWFDKVAQKVCSVCAAVSTLAFNTNIRYYVDQGLPAEMFPATATFDARAFVVPKDDVCNYFVWRQQDATRNSVSMLAQHHFDHDELQGKSWGAMQEVLFSEKGVNWNDCDVWQKRGWCVSRKTVRTTVGELRKQGADIEASPGVEIGDDVEVERRQIDPDWDTPIFTKDNWYINQHVFLEQAARDRRSDEIMAQILGPDWEKRADDAHVEIDPEHLRRVLLAVSEEFQ